jgi:hypothetical protein
MAPETAMHDLIMTFGKYLPVMEKMRASTHFLRSFRLEGLCLGERPVSGDLRRQIAVTRAAERSGAQQKGTA